MTEQQQILGCCLIDSSILKTSKLGIKFFTTQKDKDIFKLLKQGTIDHAAIYQTLKNKHDDISSYLGKLMDGIAPSRAKEHAIALMKGIEKEKLFEMLHKEGQCFLKTGTLDENKINNFCTEWTKLRSKDVSKLLNFDEIEEKKVDWHIPGIYAKGMIHALAGFQGSGKSLHLYDIAAKTSTGQKWPITGDPIPKGDVLFITDEDSREQIIKPRLRLAGADMKRIFIPDFNVENLSLPGDIFKLEGWLRTLEIPRLINIDPIVDCSKGNLNSSEDATKIIAPLKMLAEKYNLCLIYTVHFNKSVELDSVQRVAHSYVLTSKPRVVWLVIKEDPDDEENNNRILCNAKTAFKPIPNMLFTIAEDKKENPFIESYANTKTKTHEVLSTGEKRREVQESNFTTLWLKEKLKDGPVESKTLHRMASEDGISSPTLYRASIKLNVIKKMSGFGVRSSDWSLPQND